MITPAQYEDSMRINEENKNLKGAIKDTVLILKQYGYDSGAETLERMLKDDRENNF